MTQGTVFEYRQYVGDYHDRTVDFFDFSSDFGRERRNAWVQAAIGKPFRRDDDLSTRIQKLRRLVTAMA